MKKYIIIIILTALLVTTATARDFAYTYQGQTINYTVIDESAKTVRTTEGEETWLLGYTAITPGNINIKGDLVIPDCVNDGGKTYTVVEIGDYSFRNNLYLKSVTLPAEITTIGESAFSGCSNLQSVTVPKSLRTIGEEAFFGCKKLQSVTLPEGVTTIAESTFSCCEGLYCVTSPASLTSI